MGPILALLILACLLPVKAAVADEIGVDPSTAQRISRGDETDDA